MEEFDFDFHNWSTRYPESGEAMQMGNSYLSTASPSAPDQRIITLKFTAMKYFMGADGQLSDSIEPKLNFWRLEKFYQRHQRWKSFNYRHVVYGMLVVKFLKPLETPQSAEGNRGTTDSFSVELLEQP